MHKRVFRLLLIEDDPVRIERIQSWLPDTARLVTATSAGSAMGILKRDPLGTYGGIILDHDLHMQMKTTEDSGLSGTNIVNLLIHKTDPSVAILVHSMNVERAANMAERLDRAGFWVTRISMDSLTKNKFIEWVEEAQEIWMDMYR
jgi:hypothetical protein